MKRIVLFMLLLLGVFNTQAQKQDRIVFSNTTIKLDGELNEPIWEQLDVHGNFIDYMPKNGSVAAKQMKVKMFHNGKKLYISAIYYDVTDKIQIGSLKRDDIANSGGNSDSFAIIIDTYNQQQSGYFFIVNMGGALIDALVSRKGDGYWISRSWNAIWNAKTSVKGNQKIYEVEIPLKALGYKEDSPNWGIMFHARDIKTNEWITSTKIDRNFTQFDLRFSEPFEVENLSNNKPTKFTLTPSLTMDYQESLVNKTEDSNVKPSLDFQYNVSSSLKLDATLNPDFSQIDVDTQVTNLSRFAVFFPERRNFFIENSDLFTSLGVSGVNPFYSRRIGAETDILFGLKLSGNVAKKTRLGVLNVATKKEDAKPAQNYGALVVEQQLSNVFRTTGFIINRQETDGFSFLNDYNRVAGLNVNYNSKNNKWTGLANYAQSFTSNVSGDNKFYSLSLWYNSLKTSWKTSVRKVGRNYITDVGFVPRLDNYDAINQTIVREGYTQAIGRLSLTYFPKDSKKINSYKYLGFSNNTYFDEEGVVSQSSTNINNDLLFNDNSLIYGGIGHEYVNLKYAFDPLRNGNYIQPGIYNYYRFSAGYRTTRNRKLEFDGSYELGSYYGGSRDRLIARVDYKLMPLARLYVRYERNDIDLNELGSDTFHLARFSGEVFFSNRLNWTTYVQYNTQFDNFNINSRLQWEYKPLSYIYLVISDNFNQEISRQNWGVAFKMNYRFDF
ncbi:DUF5916 domain-containing protein [Tenacibaculum aiptasiae]|uniref:DUF5916 domain-containing protein n=1 Tax=Tenacibaculum aiptasiae TaxID=426481 RepID=UPI00232F4F53|nr:DUF5916 domain-containing protein [Tenacibaculum aiptasiae]